MYAYVSKVYFSKPKRLRDTYIFLSHGAVCMSKVYFSKPRRLRDIFLSHGAVYMSKVYFSKPKRLRDIYIFLSHGAVCVCVCLVLYVMSCLCSFILSLLLCSVVYYTCDFSCNNVIRKGNNCRKQRQRGRHGDSI